MKIELTRKIIGAAYTVANSLGSGLLEKVYENSLRIELEDQGFIVHQQVPIDIYYKGHHVGHYVADLVVNDCIIELKSVSNFNGKHYSQLLHYLKSTKRHLGLLINFGSDKVEVKRVLNGVPDDLKDWGNGCW